MADAAWAFGRFVLWSWTGLCALVLMLWLCLPPEQRRSRRVRGSRWRRRY